MGFGNGMAIGWPMASTNRSNPVWPNMSLLVEPNSVFNIPATDGESKVGEFTIEWFQYMDTAEGHPRVWSIGSWPNAAHAVSIEGPFLYYWINGNIVLTISIPNFANNYIGNWTNFTVQRSSNSIGIYINGLFADYITYSGAIPSNGLPLYIGSEGNDSLFYGFLSNFRWSNIALYPNGYDFTPATSPFLDQENVQLLILQGASLELELTDNSHAHNTLINAIGTYDPGNPFIGYNGCLQFGVT